MIFTKDINITSIMFSVFRFFGIAYFIAIFCYLAFVVYYYGFENEAKSLLAPLAILTSALIAGFAVERSINSNKIFRQEDKEKNIKKSHKIIKETMLYLLNEAVMQQNSIDGLRKMIQLNIGADFFYSKDMLQEKLYFAINKLAETDILASIDNNTISKIYDIRFKTLTLIHQYNILNSFVSVNNQEFIDKQISYIQSLLSNIISDFQDDTLVLL